MAAYAYTAINAEGLELKGEVRRRPPPPRGSNSAPEGSSPSCSRSCRGSKRAASTGRRGRRTCHELHEEREGAVTPGLFAAVRDDGRRRLERRRVRCASSRIRPTDTYLAAVISEVRTDVEGGALLSQALARHPKVFSRLYVSMVEAGEAAGILDEVLDRLATQIEKEANIKRRVKGALVYPMLVLSFSFLVLTAMLLFIVPIFQKL